MWTKKEVQHLQWISNLTFKCKFLPRTDEIPPRLGTIAVNKYAVYVEISTKNNLTVEAIVVLYI